MLQMAFMVECQWSDVSSTGTAMHGFWTDKSCLAMPHLVHMAVAVVMLLVAGSGVATMVGQHWLGLGRCLGEFVIDL